MAVDVQDVISRKSQGSLSFKWRRASVQEVAGNKLRVGYEGMGSEFDEVLDLETEADRLRASGSMTNMRARLSKARTMGTSHGSNHYAGRSQRRSFDGVPTSPTQGGLTMFRSFDEKGFQDLIDAEIGSPSNSNSNNNSSMLNSDDNDDIDDHPAAALMAKPGAGPSAQTRMKPKAGRARRQVSFTGKGGQVLPGAAVGYTPDKRSSDRRHSTGAVETGRRASTEIAFEERMESMGLHVVPVEPDGNCLFRALAHQTYCDESRHRELRMLCTRHLHENRDRFEIFCTFHDFDQYVFCSSSVSCL